MINVTRDYNTHTHTVNFGHDSGFAQFCSNFYRNIFSAYESQIFAVKTRI